MGTRLDFPFHQHEYIGNYDKYLENHCENHEIPDLLSLANELEDLANEL